MPSPCRRVMRPSPLEQLEGVPQGHERDAVLARQTALVVEALARPRLDLRNPLAQTLSDLVIPGHPGRHAPTALSSCGHGVLELLRPPAARQGRGTSERLTGAKGKRLVVYPFRTGEGQRQSMTLPVDAPAQRARLAARRCDSSTSVVSLRPAAPESTDWAASATPSLKSRALAPDDQAPAAAFMSTMSRRGPARRPGSRRMISRVLARGRPPADHGSRRAACPKSSGRTREAPHDALADLGHVALAGAGDLVEPVGAVDDERAKRAELGQHAGQRLA